MRGLSTDSAIKGDNVDRTSSIVEYIHRMNETRIPGK
jgi:hypothetical protein